jgi:hypothetical protein
LTERIFQQVITEAARLGGWLVYHTHDSRRSEPGFPDLVLVRDRVVFAELKTEKAKPTPEQLQWLERLEQAGAEVHLWRPQYWPQIERVLVRRAA